MLAFIEARPAFPDPDSFYHAKMALEIRDHGFIHAFPWLQETVMRDRYVDAHWLYHVLLIPFVTIFDPLVGMKVSAALFGLVAFYALYRFLRSIDSPYPEWLTLVAALSFDFLQRMSMPKAGSLSIALLMLGVWAMLKSRTRVLFAIAVLFVWLYHGWPVLVAAFVCFACGDLVARRLVPSKPPSPLKGEGRGEVYALATALFLGLLAGTIANPYFPDSLTFIALDIVKIAIAGGAHIPVGSEWSPVSWFVMFQNDILAFCAFGLSVLLLVLSGATRAFKLTGDKARNVFVPLLLSSIFAAFAVRSARYLEYVIPFLILTTGAILSVAEPFLRQEIVRFQAVANGRKKSFVILAVVISLSVGCLAAGSVSYAQGRKGFFSASQYEGSAAWLKQNLAEGAIVFNAPWDMSLIYFYLDDQRYFLVGLDPRFMYDADKERYQAWFDLQSGMDADISKVGAVFHASAILVDKRLKGDFAKNIAASDLYEMAYEDEWIQIYVPVKNMENPPNG